MRPDTSDYDPHFETYVSLVKSDDISKTFVTSLPELETFLKTIPENKGDFAYAENKWTVKQVLQHGIDAERVFAYRALCIARGETQSLPSFDDKLYADNATVQHRSLIDLTDELVLQRKSSVLLFASFTRKMLNARGIASGNPITVNSLGYITIGHWTHHQNLLRERYGV